MKKMESTTTMRHKRLNLSYTRFNPCGFKNLNRQQQQALANHFSEISQRLEEANYKIWLYENEQPALAKTIEIDDDYTDGTEISPNYCNPIGLI